MSNTKELIQRIATLSNKEKLHILNILKTHNIDFTKNANGFFFNLASLENTVYEKLEKCLLLIEANRDLIHEMDRRRDEMLDYYKTLIEDKIKTSLNKRHDEYINTLLLLPESNIKKHVTPVRRIKLRNENTLLDPDDIIKECMKNKLKFTTNSVFKRINSQMRWKKSFSIPKKEREDVTEYGFSDDFNYENDENEFIEDLVEPDPEDFGEIETDNISEDSDNSALQFDDNDNDNDNDNEEIKPKLDISYFRKLLNKQGFLFDDNKHCNLVYEPYIR